MYHVSYHKKMHVAPGGAHGPETQQKIWQLAHPPSLLHACRSTGELLATYQGHVHESVKMDACLTPSDAHVVGSSETGERCTCAAHIS